MNLFQSIVAFVALGWPLATSALAAEAWTIGSTSLNVTLTDNGSLALERTATGTLWRAAAPASGAARVSLIAKTATNLSATIEIDSVVWQLVLALRSAEPGLDLTIDAPAERAMTADLRYPFAFTAPDPAYRFVVPQKTGLMFTVEQAAWPKVLGDYPSHNNAGLAMPWVGLTNLARGDGLMLVLETPFDSGIVASLAGAPSQVFAVQPYWKPSLATVRRPRRLQVRLLDDGGYVAMAKVYRRQLIEHGEFVSLREKARAVPALEKLMGALDLHLRGDDASQDRVVRAFAERGVRKLLLNSDAAVEMQGRWRAQGLLTGAYKLYTDIHAPNVRETDPAVTRGYVDDAYTLADGTATRGYMASAGNPSTYRCSVMQLPLMVELVPPLVARQGYEALFLDVVTSLPPKECWHPRHKLDCLADATQRRALLHYATQLGVVVGSEDGSDWACRDIHYFEGMAMPRRFGYGKPPANYNNWRGQFPITDEYRRVDLNEQVRVPLFDLVYHDSVVSTWRWFYSPDQYARPELWDNFDLLTMVAGNMPIFVLSDDVLPQRINRIVRTAETAATWQARIGWDELVDHRALSADRSVQESRFGSGWAVVANFSAQPYALASGETIAPLSHRVVRWKP